MLKNIPGGLLVEQGPWQWLGTGAEYLQDFGRAPDGVEPSEEKLVAACNARHARNNPPVPEPTNAERAAALLEREDVAAIVGAIKTLTGKTDAEVKQAFELALPVKTAPVEKPPVGKP